MLSLISGSVGNQNVLQLQKEQMPSEQIGVILVVVSDCYNRPSFLRKHWHPCQKCTEENASSKGESVISDYKELQERCFQSCRHFTQACVIDRKAVKTQRNSEINIYIPGHINSSLNYRCCMADRIKLALYTKVSNR